ncbi:MAG: hypothetical protein KF816_08400 [Melioribacteraceae bacterium]|nr:hypothetical protein [Melioribacteraceae bacterium]
MKHLFLLLTLVLAIWLPGCGSESSPVKPIEPPIEKPIEKPTPATFTLNGIDLKGTTITLTGYVETKEETQVFLEWKNTGASSFFSTPTEPGTVYNNSLVTVTLSNLELGKTYEFKFKLRDARNGTVTYSRDSMFSIAKNLKIGDLYEKGVVIKIWEENSIKFALLASERDLTTSGFGQPPPGYGGANMDEALALCIKYGTGWRLPDSTEAFLIRDMYKKGVLKNFVDPAWDPYGRYMTKHFAGNTVFAITLFSHPNGDGWMLGNPPISVRAVKIIVVK